MKSHRLPATLAVDLDGTLIRTDLLLESGLSFLRSQPLKALLPMGWLLGGKARLKEELAYRGSVDVEVLPYDRQVLAYLDNERKKGRVIVLATASHHSLAQAVVEHLGLFDRVIATSRTVNLSANAKRDALVAEFGVKGFDYMGNSKDDLPVWAAARDAIVVNPEPGVLPRAKSIVNVVKVLHTIEPYWKVWPRALRVHQWAKNLLLFVPLLASHKILYFDLTISGLLSFFCFGLCASSVYLLNDLIDLEEDRHHPVKNRRPFSSGDLPLLHGLLVFPLLLLISFCISSWLLPNKFTLAMSIYYLLTLGYSLALKRMVMVDVIALASLYTMRIIAGTFVFGVLLTFWMLAFSMFIFLSLALVKRYAELRDARSNGITGKTPGRGYFPGDLEMVSVMGVVAGYLSVLVLALYIQDEMTLALYSRPEIIWLACPLLLFWVSRIWLITHRGEMHDDPVIYALKDPVSLVVGVLFSLTFWMAV